MGFSGLAGLCDETTRKDTHMTEPRALRLDVPGGRLGYAIRDAEADTTAPVLLMIAAPMGADTG